MIPLKNVAFRTFTAKRRRHVALIISHLVRREYFPDLILDYYPSASTKSRKAPIRWKKLRHRVDSDDRIPGDTKSL